MSDGQTGGRAQSPRQHPLTNVWVVRWLLLSGSRRLLTLLLSVLVLAILLTVGTVWEFEMEVLVNEARAVQSLFNTLLGGIILFVSVVLSINIAVLSQELGPLRTKQSQIQSAIEFKTDLTDAVEADVSTAETENLYPFLIRSIHEENQQLQRDAERLGQDPGGEEIAAFAASVERELGRVEDRLYADSHRLTPTLLAGLDYDLAHQITTARHLQRTYDDSLSETGSVSLANLLELLTAFASGREYFQTLYFKREVQNLTRDLLLLALPVIVFTSHVLLAIDAGLFPSNTVLGIQPRLLYVSVAYAIALSPYLLLSAYMLRIVSVSRLSTEPSGFRFDGDESS